VNLRLSPKRIAAMTLFEVGVVVAIVLVLALIFLPALAASKRKSSKITCVNNLKQVGLVFRLWSGDNNDKYQMDVSVTNGGAMEFASVGNVVGIFQVTSNELGTPKILLCDESTNQVGATNFGSGLSSKNISYFVGVDAKEIYPQMILSGDDHLSLNGSRVKSGLLEITNWSSVNWTQERHYGNGNVGLVDGSVQQLTSAGFRSALSLTGLATNRLAIP
jgi:prepilin-type processing-associated H-X9-DG protein